MRSFTRSYLDVATYDQMIECYRDLPRRSFDYEVVERIKSISVVPYAGTWKDLGTWNTFSEEMAEPVSGRVWIDAATTENVHVVNEMQLPVVVADLSDTVVVVTADGVLVTGKDASSHIKALVEEAASARPMYERRKWGEYRVFGEREYPDGSHALTKELVVLPGCQLSYQRHVHRSEVWTIVSGSGEVVLDGKIVPVHVGDSVRIAPMQLHGMRAKTELHVVEVQPVRLLVEEDIERLGLFWAE